MKFADRIYKLPTEQVGQTNMQASLPTTTMVMMMKMMLLVSAGAKPGS